MFRVPNLFPSRTASSVLIAFINSDSLILTGLLQQCKISF